jgi:cytochrome c-type biogenesis protein CcmE
LGGCLVNKGNKMSKNTRILVGIVVVVTGILICRCLIGALMLGSSVLYAQSSVSSAQYFLTIDEVVSEKDRMIDKQIRISGAIIGDSIKFDEVSGNLSFFIADVPADYETIQQQGGLAFVLENAVKDPNRQKIQIIYSGQKPQLLRNMSQAIVIGELRSDGIFYADEILLKCPSRYEKAVPDQVIN